MTTIEHMSFDRQNRAEETLLSAYFSNAGYGGPGLKLKERREVRRKWDAMWGRMKKEGNLWWRDAKDEKSAARVNWEAIMGDKWYMWIREYRLRCGLACGGVIGVKMGCLDGCLGWLHGVR